MQTAIEYYSEDIKAANNLEKEEKKNLFIDAVGTNEYMTVGDKITFDDWYLDDEFDNGNVKMSDDIKHLYQQFN